MEENEWLEGMSLKQTKKNKREKIVGGESMRVSPWIEQKKDSVALSFVFCFFYFGSHNFFSFLFQIISL